MDGWNGELAGYELKYQKVSGAGGGGQGHNTSGQRVPAERGQSVLEGLEKWSWYNITLAAFTVEGTGPSSPDVLCRTDEDGETETVNNCLIIFTEKNPTYSMSAQFLAPRPVRWMSSRSTPRRFGSPGAQCCRGYAKARSAATKFTLAARRAVNRETSPASKTCY